MLCPGNAQALGRRSEQQDALAFSDLSDTPFVAHAGALCVVCDGMGGHAAGGEAARAAVAGFLDSYRRREPSEPIPRSLVRAADAANEAVLDVARHAGDSGSTLVAAVLHAGHLHWIAIGDSRLMLWRDGRLHRINREHSHRRDLMRQATQGELPWQAALTDPLGERLTASLGEPVLPPADRSRRGFPLQPGDQVYLATDGLYRSVDTTTLAQAVEPGALPDTVCSAWVALALAADRPDQDNVTVAGLAWRADGRDDPTGRPAPSIGQPAGARAGAPGARPGAQTATASRAASTRMAGVAAAVCALVAAAWLALTPAPTADPADGRRAEGARAPTPERPASPAGPTVGGPAPARPSPASPAAPAAIDPPSAKLTGPASTDRNPARAAPARADRGAP